jgi:hypothetical protein
VECWINLGKNADDRNLIVFRALERKKDTIESVFGEKLDGRNYRIAAAAESAKRWMGGGIPPRPNGPHCKID